MRLMLNAVSRTGRPGLGLGAGLLMLTTATAHAAEFDTAAVWRKPCPQALADLNTGLTERRIEAFLTAASFYEVGRCLELNPVKAVEYIGVAARAGSQVGARRLARKFGLGQGVPQSFANAGAWVGGKGVSDEALAPWDYAVGFAYTVASEVLAGVNYPVVELRPPLKLSFVMEFDTSQPTRLALRLTSEDDAAARAALARIEPAFSAKLAQVLPTLPAVDPQLLVRVRVAIPLSIDYTPQGSFDVVEDEPVFR